MALQVLEAGKGALACAAYVRTRLVCLARGKGRVVRILRGIGFGGLGGRCIVDVVVTHSFTRPIGVGQEGHTIAAATGSARAIGRGGRRAHGVAARHARAR